jgi:hypothetical protein
MTLQLCEKCYLALEKTILTLGDWHTEKPVPIITDKRCESGSCKNHAEYEVRIIKL